MAIIYRAGLYGLIVECEYPLNQNRHVPPTTPADVVVRMGDAISVSSEAPEGTPVLEHWWEGQRAYSAARTDAGHVLRFHGACEFRISADLTHVVAHPDIDAVPDLSTILTTGGLLAYQLFVRGRPVLHASAVEMGGSAIAFVGNSGQGKSTMATLLCARGARLITDDVLSLDLKQQSAYARLGATELRLRKGADELASLFTETDRPNRRTSADHRQVLRLDDDATDNAELRAIVIPLPDRSLSQIELIDVSRKEAPFVLLQFLRLTGWQDSSIATGHFSAMVEVARRTKVFAAKVPWGPPFDPNIARRLMQLLV